MKVVTTIRILVTCNR